MEKGRVDDNWLTILAARLSQMQMVPAPTAEQDRERQHSQVGTESIAPDCYKDRKRGPEKEGNGGLLIIALEILIDVFFFWVMAELNYGGVHENHLRRPILNP
ncbi:MAG: hypothetical protein KC594_18790 [Nitrospira sp.]|nr:hypothetical protein [Nitrospira sp.]